MNVSQNGIDLIKRFEGCRLVAYRDAVGVLTIGYGHTGNVRSGERITQEQAEQLLKSDLKRYVDGVNSLVNVPINQNQFDALVSFSYNLGVGSLKKSTLLEFLNGKRIDQAADEFGKWVHADGRVLQGLVRRRQAEKELFEMPITSNEEELTMSQYQELKKEIADLKQMVVELVNNDGKPDTYAEKPLEWAQKKGISTGERPQGLTKREETITMIKNHDDRIQDQFKKIKVCSCGK